MKKIVFYSLTLILFGASTIIANAQQHPNSQIRQAIELMNAEKDEDANFKNALSILSNVIDNESKNADAYYLRALAFSYFDENNRALSDVNNAIRYSSKKMCFAKAAFYSFRAELYQGLDEPYKSISDYSSALNEARKSNPEMVTDILFNQANVYFSLDMVEHADENYKEVLKEDESNVSAMVGLARGMIVREEYDDAILLLNKCKKYNSTYPAIFKYRMYAYRFSNQIKLAVDDALTYYVISEDMDLIEEVLLFLQMDSAYSLNLLNDSFQKGDDITIIMLVIRLSESIGHYSLAVSGYDKIESLYGADAELAFHRARCYSNLSDYGKAITEFTTALNMGCSDQYYGYLMRSECYRTIGEYSKAISDINKALELNSTDAYPYYSMGWCYELMGDDDKAMVTYNKGIKVNQNYPYIYLMRGEQYLKRGEKEKAIKDFFRILEIDTTAFDGSCRHYALHFLDRDKEALEWMDDVIENSTDVSGCYYDKSCLLSRMGRKEDAVSALREAFENGYRNFSHIENDDDMDAIRNMPKFITLVEKYKNNTPDVVFEDRNERSELDIVDHGAEIDIKFDTGGTYQIPCTVNGLPLNFCFDTGASFVSISLVEANFMLKNGYLEHSDIRGSQRYSTATGEISEGTVIRIREVKIGNSILRNIDASVVHTQNSPLLLGQSVLKRLGSYTIDNEKSKLIIK